MLRFERSAAQWRVPSGIAHTTFTWPEKHQDASPDREKAPSDAPFYDCRIPEISYPVVDRARSRPSGETAESRESGPVGNSINPSLDAETKSRISAATRSSRMNYILIRKQCRRRCRVPPYLLFVARRCLMRPALWAPAARASPFNPPPMEKLAC